MRTLAEELVRLQQAFAALEARVVAAEGLAAFADNLLKGAETPIDYPATLRIDPTNSTSEMIGFHQLEYDHEGMPYRWTGPERHFSFQMFISRIAPATFNLHFGKFFASAPVEHLRGFVDGEETALSIRRAGKGYEARGEMPARHQAGGTVLSFVAPAVESPLQRGLPDNRLLGMLFLGLRVAPNSDRLDC